MRLVRLASLAAISTLTVGASAYAQELPEGPGKTVLQIVCTQCHAAEVIVRQPRSHDEWAEVVSRMIGVGAQLNDDDYTLVMEYLTTHLGPASQAPRAEDHPTAPGTEGKRDK